MPEIDCEIGQRVLYSGHVGTIRWKGKVSDSLEIGLRSKKTQLGYIDMTGEQESVHLPRDSQDAEDVDSVSQTVEVLGIEWDNCHLGSYEGTEYFKSERLERLKAVKSEIERVYKGTFLEGACTQDILVENYRPCSFILPEVQDGISFSEAIRERYLTDSEPTESLGSAEFVGRDKAVEFFSQLTNLYTVGLSGSNISRLGDCSEFKFSRVKELYLSACLLYKWSTVADILELFPKLELLDLSGNLFQSFSDNKTTSNTSGNSPAEMHQSLNTLILNRTMMSFKEAISLAKTFPSLKSLSLVSNAYTNLEIKDVVAGPTSLDLSSNYVWSWSCIFKLITKFISLNTLILSGNKLSNLVSEGKTDLYQGALEIAGSITAYSGIEELHINDNLIADWDTITSISAIFPNLRILRFKLHTEEQSSSLQNVHRQVIISIFPRLKVLNGSEISDYERINAERYYLTLSDSLYFKSTERRFGDSQTHRERLEPLHGKREVKKTVQEMSTVKTIKLCLVPDADSESFAKEPIHKKVPSRATVRDLKILCSRLFGIALADIVLVYNDGNMPLCERMDDEEAELQQYGISNDYQIRIQSRQTQF
ncbi:hypothetical protein BEWA_024020 [Theileria equi strain WA]|uniref:CAP-Gly domain-containing protein n=1 Tax=Theileria equi strain WA TaxID=1537102 RepID=L0AWD0_THEEQ|nr:hypothetical protein BEWA_024020 [Theileria equi strain WA]AFZ79553.1 hypothetical protein BEWA_024020 [Theileria equi strain WA]|eukprot:XP_004829219.1 hypothetical protein BEWA_024020 [Theileria equi strain WA]